MDWKMLRKRTKSKADIRIWYAKHHPGPYPGIILVLWLLQLPSVRPSIVVASWVVAVGPRYPMLSRQHPSHCLVPASIPVAS